MSASMLRPVGFALVVSLAACGSSHARTRLMDAEELARLRDAVPDEVAAAEAAEAEAIRAHESGDSEAAGDFDTLARLLYEGAAVAAVVNSLQTEVDTLEASLRTEAEAFAAVRAEREALAGQIMDHEARERSLHEARRAYVLASQDEPRRLRRRSPEIQRARIVAAAALGSRVRLLSAAAVALGGEAVADLDQKLSDLMDMGEGAVAIRRARELHEEAMVALGHARSGQQNLAQCRSFVEMARERDFDASLGPEGVLLRDVPTNKGRVLAELLSSFLDSPVVLQADNGRALRRILIREEVPESRLSLTRGDADLILLPGCRSEAVATERD